MHENKDRKNLQNRWSYEEEIYTEEKNQTIIYFGAENFMLPINLIDGRI